MPFFEEVARLARQKELELEVEQLKAQLQESQLKCGALQIMLSKMKAPVATTTQPENSNPAVNKVVTPSSTISSSISSSSNSNSNSNSNSISSSTKASSRPTPKAQPLLIVHQPTTKSVITPSIRSTTTGSIQQGSVGNMKSNSTATQTDLPLQQKITTSSTTIDNSPPQLHPEIESPESGKRKLVSETLEGHPEKKKQKLSLSASDFLASLFSSASSSS